MAAKKNDSRRRHSLCFILAAYNILSFSTLLLPFIYCSSRVWNQQSLLENVFKNVNRNNKDQRKFFIKF